MKQVRIIKKKDENKLEEKVNEWIKDNPNKNIINISISVYGSINLACILYEN